MEVNEQIAIDHGLKKEEYKKIVRDPDFFDNRVKEGLERNNILQKENYKTFVKLHNFRYDCTKGYFIKCNTEENETCGKCGRKKSKFQICCERL